MWVAAAGPEALRAASDARTAMLTASLNEVESLVFHTPTASRRWFPSRARLISRPGLSLVSFFLQKSELFHFCS